MNRLRAEARTDSGWQRFDRVAGLVSLLLLTALLILWFARTDTEDTQASESAAPISELTEPGDKPATADTSEGNKLGNVAPALPGAIAPSDPKLQVPSGQLAMVEPAKPKDSKKATEEKKPGDVQTDEKDKIDVSKKEIESAAKVEADKVDSKKAEKLKAAEQKKAEQKATEKPAPKKEAPSIVAPTKTGADAKPAAEKTADANGEPASGMSLASQDPAKQATFERIPKYIDKSITAAGSLTAGQGTANSSGASNGASTDLASRNSSTEAASNDVQRSASSLVKQVPKVNSVLELSSSDGRLSIDGIVSSEQVRASILKAGLQAYGMRNLTDRLSVNEAVAPFDWAENASDLIVLIGGPESETTVRVDGQTVTLTGQVDELGDKQSRALAAQQLFGTRARVDNRLKVVPKPDPKPAPAVPPVATAKPAEPVKAAVKKPEVAKPEPAKPAKPAPTDKKPAVAAAGQDASQLAEGGPGQVDKVVMGPRGMPKKFSRGDCPRVMTGVRVRFRSGAVEIPEDGRAYLDRLKRCFRSRSYVVSGHTDSRGAALNNLILSQERAQSVVDYLISIGVPSNRISAKGYGESTPVDSNRTERGRARNRRIDFRFKR